MFSNKVKDSTSENIILGQNENIYNKYYSEDFDIFFFNIYKKLIRSGDAIFIDSKYFLLSIILNMFIILSCKKNGKMRYNITFEAKESTSKTNYLIIFYFKIFSGSVKTANESIGNIKKYVIKEGDKALNNLLFQSFISHFDNDILTNTIGLFLDKYVNFIVDNQNVIKNTVDAFTINEFTKDDTFTRGDINDMLSILLISFFKGFDKEIIHIVNTFDSRIVYKNIDSMFRQQPYELSETKPTINPRSDDDKSLILFTSLQNQEEELKKIAELIKKGQTTPQEYVQNILSKPELLTNIKRLAIEHPAIFTELNKMGVLSLIKGEINPNQLTQITNLQSEVRPFIIDGKYKLRTNKLIPIKKNSIERKKY